MIYLCLCCRRTAERDDPAELPRSDEHCSHEWERQDEEHNQRDEDEANYQRMIGESLKRIQ